MNVRALAGKAILNSYLDFKWLLRAPVPLPVRLSFFFRKYISIFKNSGAIKFCGGEFHYDNRLMPALLPDYIFELAELNHLVDFANMRVAFDIGANIGQFSYVLKNMHPHLHIFSFEPNPRIFPLLQKNAAGFKHWQCFNFGIALKDSTVPLYFVPGKSGQASIYPENAIQGLLSDQTEKVEVAMQNLNPERMKALGLPAPIDFIKIDVEGAEAQVLEAVAGLPWKYLYVELSEGRAGGVSLDGAMAILRRAPAAKIDILHADTPAGPGLTHHALLTKS